MKKWVVSLVVFFLWFSTSSFQVETIEPEFLRILDLQRDSWNKQDLEGFMAFYWKSEEFTFQSGANRLRGWQALFDRYQKSYSGEKWGRLDFTDLEVKVLSPDSAYILGRWKLTSKDAQREGVFTIIFKRFPEGWRIIHDHSS